MAVYSPISKKNLEIFLNQYEIGSLIKYKGILEGIENTNFKLETSENNYILTIFEKRVHSDELPFFIKLKNHLATKKFNCPKPIKNKKGKYINILNDKYCVIISFIEGEKTSIVKNTHCRQVGNMLALLHQESLDFEGKRNNNMNYNQWETLFLQIKKTKDNQLQAMMSDINKELLYLKDVWPMNLPTGIIHADAFQDNIFFKDDKFSGLIDFYFACNDFLTYDIAITINAWCFDLKSNFKKDNFFNLIQGYESLRLLTDLEKKNLSTLLRGAAIRILLTRIHDYIHHQEGAYVEPKNPNEYYSILQFHQKNNLGKLL